MAYYEGDVLENDAGERVALQGGQWVPVQAQAANADVPMVEAAPAQDPLAPKQTSSTEVLGMQMPAEGLLDQLGAFNPAFAGTLGIGQAAKGMAAQAGRVLPAMQAVGDALPSVSGITSRIGLEIPQAGSLESGGNRAVDVLRAVGAKLPYFGEGIDASNQAITAKNMTARIQDTLRMTQGEGARMREGLLDSGRLANQLGIDPSLLTPAARNTLDMPATMAGEYGPKLQQARQAEDRAMGLGGPGAELMRENAQTIKSAYTGKIMDAFQMEPGVAPDPKMISQMTRQAGSDIDRALTDYFPDAVVRFDPEDSFAEIIGMSTKNQAAPALKILEDLGAVTRGADGQLADSPAMPLQRYQQLRTALTSLSDKSPNSTVADVANSLLQRVDATAYKGMGEEGKAALSDARFRFRIGKRLEKPGVVKDGTIDPAAFAREWSRGEPSGMRQFNELATLSDTVREVTATKAHTGNTLERGLSAVSGDVIGTLARSVLPGI